MPKNIEIFVLNNLHCCKIVDGPCKKLIEPMLRAMKHRGGEFVTPYGSISFSLGIEDGHALIGFSLNHNRVGTAAFAWQERVALKTWQDFALTHQTKFDPGISLHEPLPAFPTVKLPWLAISFDPSFLKGPRGQETPEAIILIWAMAGAILTTSEHR